MLRSRTEHGIRQKSLSAPRIILSALIIACFLYFFIFDLVLVRGRSMIPSLKPGTVALVLRCAYGIRPAWASSYILRWANPELGDVIVVRRDPSGTHDAVKRVFEYGPSFLRSERGVIYGSRGSSPLDAESPLGQVREVYVPPDSVFLLGDNNFDSYDSRHYGSIPVENIRGKVLFLTRKGLGDF